MKPGNYPLNLYRGDSYTWEFFLWKNTEQTDPIDLTDAVVAAEIRDKPAGTTIVTMTCTVVEPNEIDVTLAPDDSEQCPAKGVWDLEVIYPDGTVRTVVAGAVTVTADVTNSTVAAAVTRQQSRLRTA